MKVLFPIGSFYPAQNGGPNNTIYWISKELKKFGFEPIIVTSNSGLKENEVVLNKWLNKDFGEIIYTNPYIHYLPLTLLFYAIKSLRKIDVVHLNAVFYPPSWIIAFISILVGKKVIWSPRGELDPLALIYSQRKKKVVLSLIKLISAKILFHGTCDREIEFIESIFGPKVKTVKIPNYLEIPRKVEVEAGRNYFLYIGRIHPKKAIENLIEAFRLFLNFNANEYRLLIAGDYNNDYGLNLKSYIKEINLEKSILFIGHVEGKEKQELFAGAYFSILPSHTENFGNVVIESLAQGTPVIASKGTPWEILVEKEAGYWDDNDPSTLSNMMAASSLLSIQEYLNLRNNAYLLCVNKFDISKNIMNWISLYNSIVKV